MPDARFLTRIVLDNYKSIASCDVSPAQLTILVGSNGAGKSNFIDALRFVSESLRSSLDRALANRGGLANVRRQAVGSPQGFGIRVDCDFGDSRIRYAFAIGATPSGRFELEREDCLVTGNLGGRSEASFSVRNGRVAAASLSHPPTAAPRRLYLADLRRAEAFRPAYEALSGMAFYRLNPDAIRMPCEADAGARLDSDGANTASVLAGLAQRSADFMDRATTYLGYLAPGLVGIGPGAPGPKRMIEFRQRIPGTEGTWNLPAASMSDGALRALGLLVALFQGENSEQSSPRLIGIEEPEAGIHPANAEVLAENLRDAALRTQIIVTSHSAELLDGEGIPDGSIFVALMRQGATRIGPVDRVSLSAVQENLFSAGELLRLDQLQLDPVAPEQSAPQSALFDFMD